MQQWCSCGAAIRTFSPSRVRAWADNHRHDQASEPEPEKQGSFAQAELSHQDDYAGYGMRIGFQRNP
jgi:hypothetical protein